MTSTSEAAKVTLGNIHFISKRDQPIPGLLVERTQPVSWVLLPAVSLPSFSNHIREVSGPGVVFLVLKAMQAIKTGVVKRQQSLGSAVSLSLLGHCSVGTGTAQESGFFVLLGFSSGSFCKGLSWHCCSSEMEQPKRELAGGQPGRRACGGSRGGTAVPGARLSRAGAPCGTAKCLKCQGHPRV